jgi:hypothetical protein
VILLALVACGGPVDDTGPDAVDSATQEPIDTGSPACAEDPAPPSSQDTGAGPRPADVLSGQVTWTVDFDADAEGLGFFDCSYTRRYATLVESTLHGHLCPSCEALFRGDAEVVSGYADCYAQISSAEAIRAEGWGLATVDGAPHAFRGSPENVALKDMGAITGDPSTSFGVFWSDEAELDGGGRLLLSAAGTFTRATSADATVPDPDGARTEPYACGWPRNNPGGPNAPYALTPAEAVPNVRLEDQCGERVDLWDFRGYYAVVDVSAPDCGPCQAMAQEAEAFKARMAEACVPVELVTLLVASLGAVNAPADLETRVGWQEAFSLTSPVLADEGYGYALFPAALGLESGMSVPSVAVVAPDGTLLYLASGFGGWQEFEDVILAHAAAL